MESSEEKRFNDQDEYVRGYRDGVNYVGMSYPCTVDYDQGYKDGSLARDRGVAATSNY